MVKSIEGRDSTTLGEVLLASIIKEGRILTDFCLEICRLLVVAFELLALGISMVIAMLCLSRSDFMRLFLL